MSTRENDFLRRIEAEMRQEGLLRKQSHPRHVECTCPKCQPWEGYKVQLLNATHQILKDAPAVAAMLPRIFSVRLINDDPPVDGMGRALRRYGHMLGYFVARADCLPVIESDDVRVIGIENEEG